MADKMVRAVLAQYPKSFAQHVGFTVQDKPASLYKLLVMATLMSARIGAPIAVEAARALFDRGWTTPRKMAGSTWEQRTKTLNRSGYARYDERTSRMLGEGAELLLERYGGDLRSLREEAERDPDRERALLKEFKGIGDVGVDIFFREAQAVWDELAPFADERALRAARKLKLATSAEDLAAQAGGGRSLVRLTSALVQVELDGTHDEIRARAA